MVTNRRAPSVSRRNRVHLIKPSPKGSLRHAPTFVGAIHESPAPCALIKPSPKGGAISPMHPAFLQYTTQARQSQCTRRGAKNPTLAEALSTDFALSSQKGLCTMYIEGIFAPKKGMRL